MRCSASLRNRGLALLSLAICQTLLMSSVSYAETEGLYVVPGSKGQQYINRWNECRIITNEDKSDQLVPTRSIQEWAIGKNAYLKNIATMPGITVKNCETRQDMLALGNCSYCHSDISEDDVPELAGVAPQNKFIDVDGAAPCPSDDEPYTWILYCDLP